MKNEGGKEEKRNCEGQEVAIGPLSESVTEASESVTQSE